ncbi:MAG: TspO/MBR family protein [Candidatus Micrarchaeota archaeon]
MTDWKKLVISIAVCQLAGILGSFFTIQNIPTWYATLNKPLFSPPNWLFGPVWTLLYLGMGVSLYFIWIKKKSTVRDLAIKIFAIQLFLNFLWSFLFFGMRNPAIGLVCIIALWLSIAATFIKFKPIDQRAAFLLVPYLMWVGFATILNFYLWQLNP